LIREGEAEMKTTMVIPSYWGRKKEEGYRKNDVVYDHPTPLDEEGTLGRTLDSLSILRNKDFSLVVVGVPVAPDIEREVEAKVSSIVKEANPEVETLFFSYTQLDKIHKYLQDQGKEDFFPLLQLKGYPSIRNFCVFLPHLLGSEVAVLIDDDEIFEDERFMDKALEFIGQEHNGKMVLAVAGYYLNPDNDFFLHKEVLPWMTYWNKIDCMNRAFEEIISKGPRIKETPFVFGGNAVLHRDLFTLVPFDPLVGRGEDIDFLINAKMFGFSFFLDNELSIKHDAPPKTHPKWKQVREDIFRFVYERSKLLAQKPAPNMVQVKAEELDPYPGEFLKDDLDERIFRSNQMLAMDYLFQGDKEGLQECMNNIFLAKMEALPKKDLFQHLLELQALWKSLMDYFSSEKVAKEVGSLIQFPRE
jgi:hypothetical protein